MSESSSDEEGSGNQGESHVERGFASVLKELSSGCFLSHVSSQDDVRLNLYFGFSMIQRCLGLDQATMFPSIPSESSNIGGRLHDCSSWIKLYTITRYRHRNSETSGSMPAKFALFARP